MECTPRKSSTKLLVEQLRTLFRTSHTEATDEEPPFVTPHAQKTLEEP